MNRSTVIPTVAQVQLRVSVKTVKGRFWCGEVDLTGGGERVVSKRFFVDQTMDATLYD